MSLSKLKTTEHNKYLPANNKRVCSKLKVKDCDQRKGRKIGWENKKKKDKYENEERQKETKHPPWQTIKKQRQL